MDILDCLQFFAVVNDSFSVVGEEVNVRGSE